MRVTSRAAGGIVTPQFAATLGHAGLTDVTGVGPLADTLGFDGTGTIRLTVNSTGSRDAAV
jgi:hypothetical protein